MPPTLTQEHILATIDALPVQGRIMLRLLLLQYVDVTDEDIQYMAADRPDPRFNAGGKPLTPYISQETLQGIADRVAQYRTRARQRRERLKLQIDCLQKLVAIGEAQVNLAAGLLTTRFGLTPAALDELRAQARAAIPKPVLRELNRQWDQDEIAEEDYRREALKLEYQRLFRRIEVDRKRLAQARREYDLVSSVSLQDHEIGHIWGIPAGSLAARKAKFLHLYMQGLQARLQKEGSAAEAQTPPLDLWAKTFAVLAQKPVERSPAGYDGLEGTEARLLEKLTAFATTRMPEEQESRFWAALTQDSRHQAEYGSKVVSHFALQRLAAILEELDTTPDALEAELLTRTAPAPKVLVAEPQESAPQTEAQLNEMAEHVLRSFKGESHPDLQGRR